MQVQVKAWGNSQGIRIPKEILQQIHIRTDDILELSVENGKLILSRPFRHRTLEERTKEFGGRLDLNGEYDWGEDLGGEAWE